MGHGVWWNRTRSFPFLPVLPLALIAFVFFPFLLIVWRGRPVPFKRPGSLLGHTATRQAQARVGPQQQPQEQEQQHRQQPKQGSGRPSAGALGGCGGGRKERAPMAPGTGFCARKPPAVDGKPDAPTNAAAGGTRWRRTVRAVRPSVRPGCKPAPTAVRPARFRVDGVACWEASLPRRSRAGQTRPSR